ncbi:hypothetical protein ACI8AK_05325 [Geodermatophilus sp. SYSU D00867]
MFNHVQILGVRLFVLTELDPEFEKSAVARKAITGAISMIRSAASEIRATIDDVNKIVVDRRQFRGPLPPDGGPRPYVYNARIIYSNASASSRFSDFLGPTEDPSELDHQIDAVMPVVEAARAKGIVDDAAASRVSELEAAADQFEVILHGSELRCITNIVGLSISSIQQQRFAELRRTRGVPESVQLLLQGSNEDFVRADFDFSRAARELSGDERDEELLQMVFDKFGGMAILRLFL